MQWAVVWVLHSANLHAREFFCLPEQRMKNGDKIKTTTHSNCIDSHWPRRYRCQRELARLLTSSQRSPFSLEGTPCSSVRPEVKIVGFPSLSVQQFPKTCGFDDKHLGSWYHSLTETEQNANRCSLSTCCPCLKWPGSTVGVTFLNYIAL